MVKENKNIAAAVQKLWGLLFAFILLQILMAVVANSVLNKFAAEFEWDAVVEARLKNIALIAIAAFAIVQDMFLLLRIFRTKALLEVQPIKCVVENFIITSYRRDKRTAHNVNILLKEPVSGKLYFTYGPHSLSFYNHTVSHSGHNLVDAKIFRRDKSVVNLGDFAWLYIKRPIKVKVQADGKALRLNGKKFAYRNVGNHFDFSAVQFVEGAVDVEPPCRLS